jgi:hypothetical protein
MNSIDMTGYYFTAASAITGSRRLAVMHFTRRYMAREQAVGTDICALQKGSCCMQHGGFVIFMWRRCRQPS